jgi:hypothetical protein
MATDTKLYYHQQVQTSKQKKDEFFRKHKTTNLKTTYRWWWAGRLYLPLAAPSPVFILHSKKKERLYL